MVLKCILQGKKLLLSGYFELRYDDERVFVCETIESSPKFRFFNFVSPWYSGVVTGCCLCLKKYSIKKLLVDSVLIREQQLDRLDCHSAGKLPYILLNPTGERYDTACAAAADCELATMEALTTRSI